MNVYIWEDLEQVSDNWHTGGGLLIVAASLDRALQMTTAPVILDKEPTRVIACRDDEPEVLIVFPDAGCC